MFVVAASGVAAKASTATSVRSQSTFCRLATSYSKTKFSPVGNTLPPGTLKSDFTKLKAEEPTLVSLAPTSIKVDLQKVLGFDNLYIGEIAKVGYVPAKVPVSFDVILGRDAVALIPASAAVISYEDKACGLKLPIP